LPCGVPDHQRSSCRWWNHDRRDRGEGSRCLLGVLADDERVRGIVGKRVVNDCKPETQDTGDRNGPPRTRVYDGGNLPVRSGASPSGRRVRGRIGRSSRTPLGSPGRRQPRSHGGLGRAHPPRRRRPALAARSSGKRAVQQCRNRCDVNARVFGGLIGPADPLLQQQIQPAGSGDLDFQIG
jgi:hypothetical protein